MPTSYGPMKAADWLLSFTKVGPRAALPLRHESNDNPAVLLCLAGIWIEVWTKPTTNVGSTPIT